MNTLRRIYDLVKGGSNAPVYLPRNFFRTGFGVRAHPYLTVQDQLSEYPLLHDIKEEIFRSFLNPLTRATTTSVISTDAACAIEIEYQSPLSGDELFTVFVIADCPVEEFMTHPKPVRFLIGGQYEQQSLRVQKIVIPDISTDKRNLQKLEISHENVQRALFYADLCMGQLSSGQELDIEKNMTITGKAVPEMLDLNFNEMKWARQIGEVRFISPAKTYS